MIMIEIFLTKGRASVEQRQRLAEQVAAEVLYDASAPPAVIEAARALTQVVVHAPAIWVTGSGAVAGDTEPRVFVRASVPGTWRKDMSAELIARVTRVLAAELGVLQTPPDGWIHVVGIAEGSYGTAGRVVHANELIAMMVGGAGPLDTGGITAAQRATGTAVDPVCGMTVALSEASIVLEHGGVTYAFCCVGCRTVFAERLHGAEAA